MVFAVRSVFVFYNDGATHVIFEPRDFIARLVALAPKPSVNLKRFQLPFRGLHM
jgi:hypothetical protein